MQDALQALVDKWREIEAMLRRCDNPIQGGEDSVVRWRCREGADTLKMCADELAAILRDPPGHRREDQEQEDLTRVEGSAQPGEPCRSEQRGGAGRV